MKAAPRGNGAAPAQRGGWQRRAPHAGFVMTEWLHPALGLADLFGLFGHFLVLSLLAVGGAITTRARHEPLCRR